MKQSKLQKQAGFTLIELVIVIGVLGILLVGITGLMTPVLRSRTKVKLEQKLKQEGNFIIQTVDRIITGARDIGNTSQQFCDDQNPISQTRLSLVTLEGEAIELSCSSALHSIMLQEGTGPLQQLTNFNNNYQLTQCQFKCYKGIYGRFQKESVEFSFSLSTAGSIQPFSLKTVVRN